MYNITNSIFRPRKFSKYNITNSVLNPENSAWTTSQIQHVIHSNNHIANSTKCHFHGPKQGNNQRGKIPHLLKCVRPVLDPPKSENNGGKASSSFSSFLSFFLSFSLFFLLLFSTNCLESLLQLQSWFDLGGVHLTQICLTLGSRRNIGNKFLLFPISLPWHESNGAVAGDGAKLRMMS